MSTLLRLFSSAYRRARRAEGAGEYRRAAELYAEAGATDEAASALLFHAARAGGNLEERLSAYHDALRWLKEDSPRRREVDMHIGLAVLDHARRSGAYTHSGRERLRDAARRLERGGRHADAATAYEILGELDAAATALEAGGEVDRLESLLERRAVLDVQASQLRRALNAYEMAMSVGARREAAAALAEAQASAPSDREVTDLVRRFEERRPLSGRVELVHEDERLVVIGKLPFVVGRDGTDLVVRGASVSRRHVEIGLDGPRIRLTDLGSRNGTLIAGVPIAGSFECEATTEIGLGDDVAVRVARRAGDDVVTATVTRGLDRGLTSVAGLGEVPIEALSLLVHFEDGWPVARARQGDLLLDGQRVTTSVELLEGDSMTVAGQIVEVRR